MLKVGQIGLGNWGKRFLPILNELATVALCTNRSSQDGKRWLKKEYPNIRHTFDISDIINDTSIDAVFITSPINTHYKITKQCLMAGKNVFVEKPIAISKNEVKDLYSLARNNNLALTVGYIFTYNPILKQIKEIIGNEKINEITMQWEKHGTFGENILWNLVSHELSILYNLCGSSIKDIECINAIGSVTDIDTLSIKLVYDENQHSVISTNRISSTRRKRILIRTESGRTLVWEDQSLLEHDNDKGFIEIFTNQSNTLELELRSFINSIQTKKVVYHEEMDIFIVDTLSKLINLV